MDEQILIQNPPQKVKAMYEAVFQLLNADCDINTIKVADITSHAGIGKGTAYEYFSSKEEIIAAAMLYLVQEGVNALHELSASKKTFREKIYAAMDFIDAHMMEKQGFFLLIKMVIGSYEVPKNMQSEYLRMQKKCCSRDKDEIIDRVIEDGVRENLIKETNPFLQRTAIETQLSVYCMYRTAAEQKIETGIDEHMLREYIYNSILKLLG